MKTQDLLTDYQLHSCNPDYSGLNVPPVAERNVPPVAKRNVPINGVVLQKQEMITFA